MDAEQRLDLLEEENARLKEQIAFLRDALVEPVRLPVEFRLTRHEEIIVGHLLARDIGTRQSILIALYVDKIDDEPEIKIIDVFVCKARKKLMPFDIEIKTLWGRGYYMDVETKAMIREMCAPQMKAAE